MSVSNSLDWKRLFHQIKIIFILLCAVSYHIYNAFVKHFKLENISYKEIDKYLWKYAKYEMGSKIQITDTTVYLDRLI